MDEAAILAKACGMVNKAEDGELYVFDVEAILTAVWDEAIEAAEITVVPSIHLGEAQVTKVREKIRRLRIKP